MLIQSVWSPLPYVLNGIITVTVRMYAERKNFPLEKLEVRLCHQKIRIPTAEVENSNDIVDHFDIALHFHGNLLTEQQKQAMRDIAGKCPVHKTLKKGSSLSIVSQISPRNAD